MAIKVQCTNPQCRKTLNSPEELAGKTVQCPACGTRLQVPVAGEEPPGPQTLGDYQLVRKIGQGGMGAVYEATQTKLNRPVALKILPAKSTQDQAFLERFYREAQAAAALNHPGIIQVYDIAEDQGHHFFAMELVDGENLMERLEREGPIPVDQALDFVTQVARGLQYAHQRSIIHRDIKPDNIMVSREGQVKLADLGLAKSTEDDKGVTQTGAGLGTPYYMAPEQAEDARNVDHRADIYALGITLLHLVTGKRPFDGDSAYGIIIQHREKELPSGQELGVGVPRGVEAVVHKMAAKGPGQRYQDYDALLSDLEKVKAGQPPEALAEKLRDLPTAPATPGQRTARARATREEPKKKGKPLVGIAVAAVLLVGGLGLLLALWPSQEPARPPRTATTTRPIATKVRSPEPAAEQPRRDFAAMLAYAEAYAREHPDEFGEIISKLEEVKNGGQGTVHGMKATDQMKAWGEKWDEAARTELGKRRQLAEEHLQGWRFAEAGRVWTDFPDNLRTESARRRIDEESARVREALDGVALRLEKEAEGLLAKESPDLSTGNLEALEGLKARAQNPPDGLPDEASEALVSLVEKIDAALEGHQEVLAAERAEAFGAFWRNYERLVKGKRLESAEALLTESKGTLEEDVATRLTKDTRTVKELLARIETNLPQLKGRTIRVGGIGMKVSEVKNGKVHVEQGGAQMALGPERLDSATLLSLALSLDDGHGSALRQKALFAFYYGESSKVAKALREAAAQGVDVSLYQARLTPVLVVSTIPTGAEVVLFRKTEGGDWEKLGTGELTTPLRREAEKNTTYRAEISRDLYRSETHEVRTADGGESRLSIRLKKGGLPASLVAAFDIPDKSKDKHGNPARKGFDRKTGLPLEVRHKKTGIHLVFLPAGEFMMGSPAGEKGRTAAEGPQHLVRLTSSFYMGKYEVTQAEWEAVMGSNPSRFRGDRNPVVQISRNDCLEFLKRLQSEVRGSRSGFGLTIPTEAQWEYACRAGTKTRFYCGDDPDGTELRDYAWLSPDSGGKTRPVGEKKPNAWGLYDMHGNVHEWCDDWYGSYGDEAVSDPTGPERGSVRVYRGGSCGDRSSSHSRSASRFSWVPSVASPHLGLRVALSVPKRSSSAQRPSSRRPSTEATKERAEKGKLVCQVLHARQGPTALVSEAIHFTAPIDNGRVGANGFLIQAPGDWQRKGTEWRFRYERGGTARGLQVIHPWREGHLYVRIHPDVRVIPGGDWAKFGWQLRVEDVPTRKTATYDEVLPVRDGVGYQITSQLSADGKYRIYFDSKLVAEATVTDCKALSLVIPEGTKPPGTPSWAKSEFVGRGLPRRLRKGEAGVLVGPMDRGTNAASQISLGRAVPVK